MYFCGNGQVSRLVNDVFLRQACQSASKEDHLLPVGLEAGAGAGTFEGEFNYPQSGIDLLAPADGEDVAVMYLVHQG